MAIVAIPCRDSLLTDVDSAHFRMALGQRFSGAMFRTFRTFAYNGNDGPCGIHIDPVVEFDDAKYNRKDVEDFINDSGVFRVR
jgi:hypothetical protein